MHAISHDEPHVPEIQYEKSRPTRSDDGSEITRIAPKIATAYASAPEYARPFGQYVADVTTQKMTMTSVRAGALSAHDRDDKRGEHALSTTPSTQPMSVV